METDFWNRLSRSIQKEKQEIAHRYNIIFGNTEILCGRCKQSLSDPSKHICADLRLQDFYNKKKIKKETLREKHKGISGPVLEKIKIIGRTKTATFLELNNNTVNRWIDRGKVPSKYHVAILGM